MNPECQSYSSIGEYSYRNTISGYDASVVDVQDGTVFPFKPFFGGNGILIQDNVPTGGITISYTGAPGSGYTYSTQGVGDASVVDTQVGNNFGFKPINGGNDISVVNGPSVVINSDLTFSSPFSGVPVFSGKVVSDVQFKSLMAGSGITLNDNAGVITLSTITPTQALYVNNTLFVDVQYGGIGIRERMDQPYLTVAAALVDAQPYDTIHLRPGTYTEAVTITKRLFFYLESGVEWNAPGSPIFTVNIPGNDKFSVDGYGNFNSTTPGGQIINSINSLETIFRANSINIIGSTAFQTNTSIDILVNYIMVTGAGKLLNSTNTTENQLIKITSNNIDINNADFYSVTGSCVQINSNKLRIISQTNSPSIVCTSTIAISSINVQYLEIQTSPAGLISLTDTDSSVARSEVSFYIKADKCKINGSPLINLTSNKPANLQNIYPRFYFEVNTLFISNIGSLVQPGFIKATNGDIYASINNMTTTLVNNNTVFAQVLGTFNLTSNGVIDYVAADTTYFIDATYANLSVNTLNWNGIITSTKGAINGVSLFSTGQITGSWTVNCPSLIMTNTTNALITCTGDISLMCNTIQLNTGSNNNAILASVGAIKIKAQELLFSFTNNHTLVNILSVGNSINADLLRDIALVNNGSIVLQGIKFLCQAAISNSIISSSGNLTFNFPQVDISNRPNGFTSSGTSNFVIDNLLYTGTGSAFTITGGVFNIDIKNATHSPTANSIFMNMSAGTTNAKITKLITSINTLAAFNTTSVANLFLTLDYATLTNLLCALGSTGTTNINCKKVSSTSVVVNITGTTQPEISGSYTTTAANVVTNNISTKLSINSAKLISTSSCITSVNPTILNITPSSASFDVPLLITKRPVLALFIDPLLT